MTLAYLILAHEAPRHFARLTKVLSTDSCGIFAHIDAKSNIDHFRAPGMAIHFTGDRVPVFWGDFSQVEAILVLIRAALADPQKFERLVLISGTDYPLRSAVEIANFFATNSQSEFINAVAMPAVDAGKPLSRLTRYRPRPGEQAPAGGFPKERDHEAHLRGLAPYGGATWWALSRQACEFILAFVAREAEVVRFFENTHLPDESFIQTILANSDFKERIVRNVTYADWRDGGSHPAYITDAHLSLFASQSQFGPDLPFGPGEMIFARKFADDSGDLVERLDRQIAERERPAPRGSG